MPSSDCCQTPPPPSASQKSNLIMDPCLISTQPSASTPTSTSRYSNCSHPSLWTCSMTASSSSFASFVPPLSSSKYHHDTNTATTTAAIAASDTLLSSDLLHDREHGQLDLLLTNTGETHHHHGGQDWTTGSCGSKWMPSSAPSLVRRQSNPLILPPPSTAASSWGYPLHTATTTTTAINNTTAMPMIQRPPSATSSSITSSTSSSLHTMAGGLTPWTQGMSMGKQASQTQPMQSGASSWTLTQPSLFSPSPLAVGSSLLGVHDGAPPVSMQMGEMGSVRHDLQQGARHEVQGTPAPMGGARWHQGQQQVPYPPTHRPASSLSSTTTSSYVLRPQHHHHHHHPGMQQRASLESVHNYTWVPPNRTLSRATSTGWPPQSPLHHQHPQQQPYPHHHHHQQHHAQQQAYLQADRSVDGVHSDDSSHWSQVPPGWPTQPRPQSCASFPLSATSKSSHAGLPQQQQGSFGVGFEEMEGLRRQRGGLTTALTGGCHPRGAPAPPPLPTTTIPRKPPTRTEPHGNHDELDYLMNRFARMDMTELKGNVAALSRDQHGCRYLQRLLDQRDPTTFTLILEEVLPVFPDLMMDPFGNYLCQKVIEVGPPAACTAIVRRVAPDMQRIASSLHGTRAAQKLIESLQTDEQIHVLMEELKPVVLPLVQDLNGNHVIQKCLSRFSLEQNQFIYDALSKHCVEAATHRHGCCVVQRCMDHAKEAQMQHLLNELRGHIEVLAKNAFGNYVVQYALEKRCLDFTRCVVEAFRGQCMTLSLHKFSSNVMEKLLRVADVADRRELIGELEAMDVLDRLIRDPYGNYVVQTCIDQADHEQREKILDRLCMLLQNGKPTPYAKRIQNKVVQYRAGANSTCASSFGNAMNSGTDVGMGTPYNVGPIWTTPATMVHYQAQHLQQSKPPLSNANRSQVTSTQSN